MPAMLPASLLLIQFVLTPFYLEPLLLSKGTLVFLQDGFVRVSYSFNFVLHLVVFMQKKYQPKLVKLVSAEAVFISFEHPSAT